MQRSGLGRSFAHFLRGDPLDRFLDKIFLLRRAPEADWPRWKRAAYAAWPIFLLACASVCMGLLLLVFAYGQYSWGTFLEYFTSPALMALNILPVAFLIFLFYGLTSRAWLAFLLGGGAALGFSLGNYYKLSFRDDPLYMEDIFLNLREAAAMATGQHYDLFMDKRVATALICWLGGTLVLFFLVRGRLRGWKGRGTALVVTVAAGAALTPLYLDEDTYDSVGSYEILNQWSATQNYIAHGFFYPFLHSVTEFVESAPEGYSAEEAEALLSQYQDADIPEDKKVNVISIMREAYADFSQFDIPGLDGSGYDLYHSLEAESYHGTLLTNIFAGGTVDSERCFLTGDYQVKNFRSATNSYLWYLRDQGYTVEGSHPYYQWFYNRQNINSYLGFERYRFYEGDYEKLTSAALPEDSVLYQEVYQDFVANKATGKPYFSFNLTVQSHGPYYTDAYYGQYEYLTGDYSDECKNAMNNYMNAIMQGDAALLALVDQLRADEDPVVLVVFSDHMPWMGDSNVFYEELGLDIDPGTEAGFRNHYSTEYLIWANDAAKAVLGEDFTGEGPTISPCYLMNLVFDLCSWDGPAFMQAMDEMMAVFPVVTTHDCYVVDGVFTDAIPQERQDLFRDFLYLQYYWRSEFLFEEVLG